MADETLKAIAARLSHVDALLMTGHTREASTIINRLIRVLPDPGAHNMACAHAETMQLVEPKVREANR